MLSCLGCNNTLNIKRTWNDEKKSNKLPFVICKTCWHLRMKKTNAHFITIYRRASRCLSPLLIPPKSPTPSDSSNNSPVPLSPLLGTLQLDLYQRKDMTLFLPKDKQPGLSPHDRNAPLGRVHFRLRYDLDKSDLHVHVIEGKDRYKF